MVLHVVEKFTAAIFISYGRNDLGLPLLNGYINSFVKSLVYFQLEFGKLDYEHGK